MMAKVFHSEYGEGTVLAEVSGLLVVRFGAGIQTCEPASLRAMQDPASPSSWSPGLQVLAKMLALAIRSVNDQWGVFSASRIALLPHQLWVCKRVLGSDPARWLIADDVGLGKTVEAGLVLSALRGAQNLKKFLVIAPASLCEQWQKRLHDQFDLRTTIYRTENDTPKSHFWEQHNAVIASLHTLREDRGGRRARLLGVRWDLVIVDEAHHLHADAHGWTLAYQLLHELVSTERTRSLLFFTGTPHRGKDEDFFALVALLRPDLFDPKRPAEAQLGMLPQVMVRNNKTVVTDMRGRRLFVPTTVRTELWAHSEEERAFYEMLTKYILDGRAFASGLADQQRRTAFLVLIAIQKLASSSIAAVTRALEKRLARARKAEALQAKLQDILAETARLEDDSAATADRRALLEESLAEMFVLGEGEVESLDELISRARRVRKESRVERILELIEGELAGRSVLFFTEYKATQALLLMALRRRFGEQAVTFINGDGYLDVRDEVGGERRLQTSREEAARRFNQGTVRFLISTEAAGEGIDLHGACHTLVHVDMPWNPMRMHQRAGRLNRYGQVHAVEIVSLRNPDTVEGRIWECLQRKLESITAALGAAMEQPEDMMQLVLGLESPGYFERLFAEAPSDPARLDRWFDAQTATFGGERAVKVVQAMLGNVARFDFQTVMPELPQLDLPDLLPFMKAALTLNRREYDEADGTLGFIVPEGWREWGILGEYRGERALSFKRSESTQSTRLLAGVGFRIVDKALDQALALDVVAASVKDLEAPIAVFTVDDAVTTDRAGPRQVVLGTTRGREGEWVLLRDGELVTRFNALIAHPRSPSLASAPSSAPADTVGRFVAEASEWLEPRLADLGLGYRRPRLTACGLLHPA